MNRYDICVVGAGIAGSAFASAVSSEFKTCIVEKTGLGEVGRKACGGAVASSWFHGGVSPEGLGAATRRIKDMRLIFGGDSVRVGFRGYVLDRHKFCRRLLENAIADGCDHVKAAAVPAFGREGLKYVHAGREKIEAGIYVDASGPPAALRGHYLANKREMFASGISEVVEGEVEDELNIYLLNHRETCWIFPSEHSMNVGHVTTGMGDSVGKLGSFKMKIGLAGKGVLDRSRGPVPIHKPIRLTYDNLVAIGDAGFTVNPITCGGIGPSVWAANLLAETLKGERGLGTFESEYWQALGRTYTKFYGINRVLRDGRVPLGWAVKAYYGGGSLGRFIKWLLRV